MRKIEAGAMMAERKYAIVCLFKDESQGQTGKF